MVTNASFVVVTAAARGGVARRILAGPASLVVGRGDDCDLILDDGIASRRHAIIHARDGELFVEDLGSRNGTFVVRILPARGDATAAAVRVPVASGTTVRLEPGAVLQIGGALLATFAAALGDAVEAPHRDRLSPAMQLACDRVEKVAMSDLPVLILGETGVGKEVFARRLHSLSARRERPFLAINCGQTTEALLDSELFGHERGAFTGAMSAKPGLIEACHGGVFFLDEVGEMPPVLQVKLLRVLQELRFRRLGATNDLPIDVRFVAATNRDLRAEVAAGRFREDLYYRLVGMTIVVPPLRERRAELPYLTHQLLQRACERDRVDVPAIDPSVIDHLQRHDWPGNVRELGNVIARARVLAAGGPIGVEHLVFDVTGGVLALTADARTATADVAPPGAASTGVVQADPERARIEATLTACGGNQTRAAAQLGMTRRALIVRLERYGLTRPRKTRDP